MILAGPLVSPSQAPARVVIHHHPADAAAASRARELQERLSSEPDFDVEIQQVSALVSADNLRIFFESDRSKAESTVDLLSAGQIPIRDFSAYRPLPRPGTIELWLSGKPAAAAPAAPALPSDSPSASAPVSRSTPVANRQENSSAQSSAGRRSDAETLRLLLLQPGFPQAGSRN